MKKHETRLRVLVFLSLICLGNASAFARFEQGTYRVGASLGLRGTDDGVEFSLGGAFGFFLLDGLDLGLSTVVQTGGVDPTLVYLSSDLRFIPLPDLQVTPFLKTSGGRLFVIDFVDAWLVSAGGGLIYLMGPRLGLEIGAGYRWYFYPHGDPISTYYLQMGLMFLI